MAQPKTIKEKLQGMFPKIPDVGEITKMMDDRFQKLLDKLDEILQELRKQNGGTP
jgi:hypothetical protein